MFSASRVLIVLSWGKDFVCAIFGSAGKRLLPSQVYLSARALKRVALSPDSITELSFPGYNSLFFHSLSWWIVTFSIGKQCANNYICITSLIAATDGQLAKNENDLQYRTTTALNSSTRMKMFIGMKNWTHETVLFEIKTCDCHLDRSITIRVPVIRALMLINKNTYEF